jgi:hypothetical protein
MTDLVKDLIQKPCQGKTADLTFVLAGQGQQAGGDPVDPSGLGQDLRDLFLILCPAGIDICSSSALPRIMASGLLISWATPAESIPSSASRSLRASSFSVSSSCLLFSSSSVVRC